MIIARKNESFKLKENTGCTINLELTGYVLKGIAINGFNPFTIIMWIAVFAIVMTRKDYTDTDFVLFFTGLLSIVISADILKAYLANRIAKILTPETLHVVDSILGGIFIVLSFRFFYSAVVHYEAFMGGF